MFFCMELGVLLEISVALLEWTDVDVDVDKVEDSVPDWVLDLDLCAAGSRGFLFDRDFLFWNQ